jgi:hypothetical protein
VSFGSALVRAIALARRLRSVWKDQPMVGILLPPSVVWGAGEFCRAFAGKGAGQSQLHRV